MTDPTAASAGTKTNFIRVVGSNFGSAANATTTHCNNTIPVHSLVMFFILLKTKTKKKDEKKRNKCKFNVY